MNRFADQDHDRLLRCTRREFVRTVGICSAATGGLVLGVPGLAETPDPPKEVETNLADFMKVPRTRHSIPGPFPGKVVSVTDPKVMIGDKFDAKRVAKMVKKGITGLTGQGMDKSFAMFFEPRDVVGIKVNPVGPPLINVRHELVDALIVWLTGNGLPRRNIVIWDRFDYMLAEGGYTAERYPGVQLAGLQTMGLEGKPFRNAAGEHVSAGNFDPAVFYFAKGVLGTGVKGYGNDDDYFNQHVVAGEYSHFGRLVTEKLTKIINVAVFKNTGNGISMATKNLGYGVINNTGRLHAPVFFRVCTEVCAAPPVRDKLVLNIVDGLRGQYDGGPMLNEKFVYAPKTLYFGTDPFAVDMVGHQALLAKRKEAGVTVNEHPKFTQYLHDAEKLGLGVADPAKIKLVAVKA